MESAKLSRASDSDLARAVVAGQPGAPDELVRRYQHRVFGICLNLVGPSHAADLTQDALLRVLIHLDRFTGASELSTWIYRVTTNICLTFLRRQRRSPVRFDGQGDETLQTGELASDGRVQQTEQASALGRALLSLPDEQRAIIVLRDVRGLEYEHLASVLEIPLGTVRSRLFRARKALREAIERSASNQDPNHT
jgi:RNA polymerase sigma-70 factor (ECF subfamily)